MNGAISVCNKKAAGGIKIPLAGHSLVFDVIVTLDCSVRTQRMPRDQGSVQGLWRNVWKSRLRRRDSRKSNPPSAPRGVHCRHDRINVWEQVVLRRYEFRGHRHVRGGRIRAETKEVNAAGDHPRRDSRTDGRLPRPLGSRECRTRAFQPDSGVRRVHLESKRRKSDLGGQAALDIRPLGSGIALGPDKPKSLLCPTTDRQIVFFPCSGANPQRQTHPTTLYPLSLYTDALRESSSIRFKSFLSPSSLASATGSKPSAFQAESFQHLCWIMVRWSSTGRIHTRFGM